MTALGLLLTASVVGASPALQLADYRTALDGIATRLDSGDPDGAAELASTLLSRQVSWEGEELLPDPALLATIARGEGANVRVALDALRSALAEAAPVDPAGTAEDRRTLERLMRETTQDREQGVALPGMPEVELPLRERIGAWLSSAVSWLGKQLRAFLRWLDRWWRPSDRQAAASATGAVLGPAVLTVVGAIAVLLIALAVVAIARLRGRVEVTAPAPVAAADADPTSRDEPAWRARAEALAAEGRHREAIRASYHALLVRCFETGVLQPRRGTTNREYARTLDGRLPWSSEFDELTLRFDLEWYGREVSTRDAFREFAARTDELLRLMLRAEAA